MHAQQRFSDSPGWPLVQVPETARLAIEAVQDGYAVVIGLQSTGEARPALGQVVPLTLLKPVITQLRVPGFCTHMQPASDRGTYVQ